MADSTSNGYTHRNVLRRQIKRLTLLVSELGVLVVGFFLSFTFAVFLAHNSTTSPENWLATVTFLGGLIASIVAFVLVRRKTRRWKFEYRVVSWMLSQSERKLHPTRSKYKRMAKRVLAWVPATIAAAVLLFFPVATHLVHPSSHYLRHYLVPIPWTFAVFPSPGGIAPYRIVVAFGSCMGQFGFARFWDHRRLSSALGIGSIRTEAHTTEFNHRWWESRRAGAAQVLRREFRLNDTTLTCWQYRYRAPLGSSGTEPLWWHIYCETPVDVYENNLYAWFVGREEDIPAFYGIIQGVKPVK